MDKAKVLQAATAAAIKAGNLIKSKRLSGDFSLSFKSGVDPVTSADIESEKLIIDQLATIMPGTLILAEESSPTISTSDMLKPLWIIDPIDGTTNYAYNIPYCAVCIAYAERGEIQVGVVHAPFLNETYTAVRGQGAQLNGHTLIPRQTTELKMALVATGFKGLRQGTAREIAQLEAIMKNCRDIRRFGAASLDICAVASGRIDGYYETIKPWDFAAAALVASESGARVGSLIDYDAATGIPRELVGQEFFVASAGVYDKLRALLQVPD
ncbi:MAG: inositol monophosphatase [Oligoflexia bacterium]|nr:inositol monophosphatase [Oligoflexia bacterium]